MALLPAVSLGRVEIIMITQQWLQLGRNESFGFENRNIFFVFLSSSWSNLPHFDKISGLTRPVSQLYLCGAVLDSEWRVCDYCNNICMCVPSV